MALIKCHECNNEVSTQAEVCPQCGAPVKKPMSQIVKFGGGFLAAFTLLIIYSAVVFESKNDGHTNVAQAADTKPSQKPEQKSTNPQEKSSSIVDMDKEMQTTMTDIITSAGFNCPSANFATRKGPDVYGDVMQVYCGPKGTTDAYANLVYKVVFMKNNEIGIEPWKD